MKSIISTTYDDKYFYFLPIVTWCWNKLNVDVICFLPDNGKFTHDYENGLFETKDEKLNLVFQYSRKGCMFPTFNCPEHKEATYAQCSRLYGACLDLPEDEVLITGDVDMGIFNLPKTEDFGFSVIGSDLVPAGQFPMCYISATVKDWRNVFELNDKTYQQCLDNLLGEIECDHFRGNYWGKDQEEAYNKISPTKGWLHYIFRAKEGTQFATKRYDRDDAYLLERLSPDTIDYHMPRPGYEDAAFNQILTVLQFHYPSENFQWLIDYTNQYKALL